MNLNKIGIIIGREYSVRVKKKSFILTTLLTPVFVALLILVPSLIMLYNTDKQQKLLVVDRSGLMQSYFESGEDIEYTFADASSDIDKLKSNFEELGTDVLVIVSALDSSNDVSVTTYSKEPVSLEMKSNISGTVETAVRDYKLKAYNIADYDEIMSKVRTSVRVDALTLTSDGGEKEDSVEAYMVIAYIMSFLIYIFTFMFGNMVMRGVIEEKSSRIIEVIVSSVSSFELMMGKIIGVAGVALTQFLIWILLTFALVAGGGALFGADVMAAGNEAAVEAAATSETFMSGILGGLAGLNIPYLLTCFVIFFLLGYLLYASMFAAVGSAVDNEADTSQLSMPITIPLILGLFIMLHAFQHPTSSLSFWASIIPFTSPMVMLARLPFGVVPAWQLALSIFLLVITFIFVTYLSAKIYRVGILMYGKKASFKDLYKWMKSKK